MTVRESSDHKNPAELFLDLCVYAPIGFALEAHRYVPELAERGRNQVALARTLGKFAVDRLEQQFPPLAAMLETVGLGTEASSPPSSAPPPTSRRDTRAGNGRIDVDSAAAPVAPAAGGPDSAAPDEGVPVEEGLAIPGYASLAASQVVPRLAGLDVHELAAIRRYETVHRARRTVLNRVDQLLARVG